jgi:hypothetical protein
MPGQARKFTDEQRTALVRAVLVDGMTQLAAIRAAEAGELIEGQSFSIARGTLQGYIRRAAGDARDEIQPEQLRAQLLSALKREIDAELPKVDGRKKLDFIGQAGHALNALERGAQPKKKDPLPASPEAQQLRSESLERLAEAHKAGDASAPDPTHSTEDRDQTAGQPAVAVDESEALEVEAGRERIEGRAHVGASVGPSASRDPLPGLTLSRRLSRRDL